jgi:flagellar protein FlbD
VIKLTRLNNHVVAINPDHIGWIETTPDTTLFLIGGEKIIVRESLDDLIALVVEFRRCVRLVEPQHPLGAIEGDPPRVGSIPVARRLSERPGSMRPPASIRFRGGE